VVRVGGVDLALEGGEHQQVDVQAQKPLVVDRLGVWSAGDRARLAQVLRQGGRVQPAGIGDAAADIGDGHQPTAALVDQPRGGLADVAETLDGNGRAVHVDARLR
jgi:hypothetical protein